MMTDEQYLAFERYVAERIASEPKFHLHPDFITRRFGIVQPFWDDLNRRAADQKHPDFVFNPHHCTSDGEPTEIVFERRG
jgi:hypothetical protein